MSDGKRFSLIDSSSCCREGLKAKKRVTKLVLVVVAVFIGNCCNNFLVTNHNSLVSAVCWAPIHIVFVKKSLSSEDWGHHYGKLTLQARKYETNMSDIELLIHIVLIINIYRFSLMCWPTLTHVSILCFMQKCLKILGLVTHRYSQ